MSSESENLEEISESENNMDEEVAQQEAEEAAAKQKADDEEAARVAAEEAAAKQKAEEEAALTVAKKVENIEIKIKDVNDIIEEPEKNVTIQLPPPPPVIPTASQIRPVRRGSRRRPGMGMITLRK